MSTGCDRVKMKAAAKPNVLVLYPNDWPRSLIS